MHVLAAHTPVLALAQSHRLLPSFIFADSRNTIPHNSITNTFVTMDRSPLGKLPPELRNCLYELYLVHPTTSNVVNIGEEGDQFTLTTTSTKFTNVALTQTCRLIRQESVQILYAGTIFRIPQQSYDPPSNPFGIVLGYFDYLGDANAALVRHVHIKGHPTEARRATYRNFGNDVVSTRFSDAMLGADQICSMAPNCIVKVEIPVARTIDWIPQKYLPKLVLHLGRKESRVETALRRLLDPFVEYAAIYGATWACGWMQKMIDVEWEMRQECDSTGGGDQSKYWAMLEERGSQILVRFPFEGWNGEGSIGTFIASLF